MARIRSIKPEFPQSESMGRVSRDARLLFVLLWTICDDHGRSRAHSRMLASTLFPYDEDAGEGVKRWLDELANEGCIRLYEVNGSQYLQITGWSKHQKIDKPSKPQFPGPSDDPREDSRESIEYSENTRLGREGKGREWIGEEGSRGESTRGTRLPADWKPTPEELRWAVDARPDVQVNLEVEKFRDYWHGATGAKATKRDWPATWRNWIRNAHGSGNPRANGQRDESVAASRPL